LIWLFSYSNFAVGTTLSKTEVLQVALLEAILLREAVTPLAAGAIVVSSIGVLTLSAGKDRLAFGNLFRGLGQKSTLIGLASGFFLGASSVLFRGAALSLHHDSLLTSAAFTLVLATLLQTVLVTIWLMIFEKGQISSVVANWRVAATVGFAGWIASICWFTAFTLTNAAYVRALGQVELVFTFLVSVLFFREKVTRAEIGGAVLLASGIVILIIERVT
jgi:drug/metabolite transporter (DMT)-like permease